MEKLLEEMQEKVAAFVAGGFEPKTEIIANTVEIFQDDYTGDDLHRKVEEMVTVDWDKHLAMQDSWPEITDCDRLTMAFDELNKSGIVARENFSCCRSCGCAEIDEEDRAETAEGYVFYHRQDTENAAYGYGLDFNYGSFSEGQEKYDQLAREIGHRIVAALKAAGLKPDWDSDLKNYIHLPLEWKKRRI